MRTLRIPTKKARANPQRKSIDRELLHAYSAIVGAANCTRHQVDGWDWDGEKWHRLRWYPFDGAPGIYRVAHALKGGVRLSLGGVSMVGCIVVDIDAHVAVDRFAKSQGRRMSSRQIIAAAKALDIPVKAGEVRARKARETAKTRSYAVSACYAAIRKVMHAVSWPWLIERSNRGVHLVVVFERPLPIANIDPIARALELELASFAVGKVGGIEVFPKGKRICALPLTGSNRLLRFDDPSKTLLHRREGELRQLVAGPRLSIDDLAAWAINHGVDFDASNDLSDDLPDDVDQTPHSETRSLKIVGTLHANPIIGRGIRIETTDSTAPSDDDDDDDNIDDGNDIDSGIGIVCNGKEFVVLVVRYSQGRIGQGESNDATIKLCDVMFNMGITKAEATKAFRRLGTATGNESDAAGAGWGKCVSSFGSRWRTNERRGRKNVRHNKQVKAAIFAMLGRPVLAIVRPAQLTDEEKEAISERAHQHSESVSDARRLAAIASWEKRRAPKLAAPNVQSVGDCRMIQVEP